MEHDRYIGRLLDNRYEILEVIGTGGMAVVYKARCHRLNRLVAIKILKDEYSQDEEFRRRFHAEGQAVAMLSHPNIVQVYDVSSSDNADFIVMELIDGITLKQYMEKRGVLNWKETLHFAMQIAKALEHAHSRGIIHRDIKPHNVMVLKNGSVKVTDFGIARVMSKSNTLTKEALGSVHYISPEQAKGGRVDNRSDLYSLAVVMYEMMTGRPPYDGESPVAIAIQHINGGAPMPSTLNPNIPGGLEQIIMKSMAQEPGARYPSATAMLYDMDEFRKNPAMLFDFGGGSIDDATRILSANGAARAGEQPRRTAADRAAGEQPRRRPPAQQPGGHREAQPRRQEPKREERDNRAAVIAVVACSAVAVVAIIIFLVLVLNGGLMNRDKNMLEVPNLVGQYYEQVKDNEDFEIVLQSSRNDETVEEGIILEQTPDADDGKKERGIKIYVIVSMGPAPEIPVMEDWADQGLDAAQVMAYLSDQGYYVLLRHESSAEVEEGYIIRTEPGAGTELTEGQKVVLVVSTGPEVVTGNMPNVVGKDLETATSILNSNGFFNIEYEEVESNEEKGQVVGQSEERNTELDVTTRIVLEISKGPTTAKMPPVVGMQKDAAEKLLNSAGFDNLKFNEVESDKPAGEIISQSHVENTDVEVSTQIVLEVSKGPKVEEPVTVTVSIPLPAGREEGYFVSLRQGNVEVLDLLEVTDLTLTEVAVQLEGIGTQYYDIYIISVSGEEYFDTVKVDFTANG